jgi:hypothetical protein
MATKRPLARPETASATRSLEAAMALVEQAERAKCVVWSTGRDIQFTGPPEAAELGRALLANRDAVVLALRYKRALRRRATRAGTSG